MNLKDMVEVNILPKQILANYKYENNHVGPCMFDFKIKKVWDNKWAAYYINQCRGDNFSRYLISFIGNSEQIVKNEILKWVSRNMSTFKCYGMVSNK